MCERNKDDHYHVSFLPDFPAAALEIFQKWLGRQSTTDYEELRQILRSVIEKNDGKLRLIHDFNEGKEISRKRLSPGGS